MELQGLLDQWDPLVQREFKEKPGHLVLEDYQDLKVREEVNRLCLVTGHLIFQFINLLLLFMSNLLLLFMSNLLKTTMAPLNSISRLSNLISLSTITHNNKTINFRPDLQIHSSSGTKEKSPNHKPYH